ncbi:hypothetical protein L2D14_15395 [Thalassospiraceae bacterium LMO-JJ14]|nr:hypothetical protein L2D14_15395 [Thalassospiraceae bacterium LMO-JJ14]
MRLLVFVIFVICLAPLSLNAQNNRYSTWSDPSGTNSGDGSVPAFIEKLNKLIDEAEKAKAADPVFLQDLRNLAQGAVTPWNTVLLDDSFTDGNFTANPVWEVLSGAYFIETGWGLRNRLITAQQTQQSSSGGGEDLAKVLLGQILKRATGTQSGNTGPTQNVIVTRAAISNAFALELEMSSWQAESHFEVGVFQGANAAIGYRLLYVSGKGLQLHRVGSSGSSVIATSDPATLEDKKFHKISWTRGTDGAMHVSLDDKEMIVTSDRAFSDPFDGVRISDSGGDFIIKRVALKGI